VNGFFPGRVIAVGSVNLDRTLPVPSSGALPVWSDDRRPALVVNEVEARQLTGADDPRSAARIPARTASGAVVTLGSGGALVDRGGECEHLPAPTVTAPRDLVRMQSR
jgi:hypothetical protein